MTLRDLTGLSYMHRERARYAAGTSELLGVVYAPLPGDGFVIACANMPELQAIRSARTGLTVGAFTPLAAVSDAAPEMMPPGTALAAARLRLSMLDATVTIAGMGRTRSAPYDALKLAPHELPIEIDIPPLRSGIGFGDRQRRTNDGDASFALGVSVALRVSALGRFERVRIFVDFEGTIARAVLAEAKLEKQRCDPGFFAETARLAAYAIATQDARTSAAARSITPLAMAALRDALAAAKPKDELPPRRARAATPPKRRLF